LLLSRLVDNIIDNAIGHNQPGGWARVATAVVATRGHLVVDNGGPVLDPDQVGALTQPCGRIGAERTGSDKGAGMGLAIMSSIVKGPRRHARHRSLPNGGLRVVVKLPLAILPAGGTSA
jgi:K+-sensing histidine kinase KdpD